METEIFTVAWIACQVMFRIPWLAPFAIGITSVFLAVLRREAESWA